MPGHFRREDLEIGDNVTTISVHSHDRGTLLTKGVSINKGQTVIKGTFDMTNESSDWIQTFRTLFDQKVLSYKKGTRNADAMFPSEEKDFLRSIGATPQEIYDFVEDWCDDGEPDPDMVVAITQIRRDYFLNDQQGQYSKYVKITDLFPPREAKLAGLEWFPRIIEKAKAKLRGELPPDLMYSCGADRRFLKKTNVDPAEFLQVVREAGDDVEHIVKFVTNRSQA
ncbi:MAG: DUF5069 domain-containing protein [Nitrospirales bacterium]|nr:DUF5069 domain-containing protein [Nitrospirales bacterium]